ncbi:hypothetical protein CHS0354_009708 [Potamilus streckersoni]|uniref:Mitochondria-eating protein C-terminal domain-containing protein n=1 Tax=Potamilus streckersoni TaxID=2493646 RepID=A0AAE0VN27_9BIVA|nr:hypothetical protein CHS0354_009708 [Potamilus streckersoni]
MDQRYKSAASKLEEILKENKQGLSKDQTSLTALIKELKDGVPGKTDIETKFKVLENTIKRNQPGIWIQLEEIRKSLATDLTETVGSNTSNAAPEPQAGEDGDTEMGLMEDSFRVIIEILETNRDIDPFPKPDERQKEKIGECYEYALKVARLCKERKSDLELAYKIIGDIHNQVMEVDADQAQEGSEKPTTTSFNNASEGTRSKVQKKTEHNKAPELEKKGRTASPALNKKYANRSSQIVNKVNDDQAPTKTEPNIAQQIEMKSTAVSSALKKMKDTKGDLEYLSKIIENLHDQVMEVNVDQAQITEAQTATRFKQVGVDTGSTVHKNTERGITPKRGERANTVSSTSTITMDTAIVDNKETQENKNMVPKKIEHNILHELDMKATIVSEALQQIKYTKERVKVLKNENEFLMQLLDGLHVSVIGVEHKKGKRKPSARTGNDPSRHDMASKILRSFQEKKSEAEYAACLLEELSRFLHSTNKDDNGNILSRPENVKTSQEFKEKDAKNVHDSEHKLQQCFHDENLMKSYKDASQVLKEMKESKELRIDLETKTDQLEVLRTKRKSIQDENAKLMNEADSLRTRLSEHAGALLNHNNPAIADLSDPNRATKLGEKYLQLYDNQWTDAFSKLEKEYSSSSDEELTGHLYNILVDGYVFCNDARRTQILNLQEIMFNPTGDMEQSRIRPKEMSESFSNSLSDAAKLSSKVTSGNMARAFAKNEETKKKYGKMIKLCEAYIQECVQLCWYMQVHTPPLCLDLNTVKGNAFDKNKYKEYTTKGKKIVFVVWPALFLHENGLLLSKGVAQGDSTRKQAAED